jgi:RNA polymerase sigma factor (TIGR02999 family)
MDDEGNGNGSAPGPPPDDSWVNRAHERAAGDFTLLLQKCREGNGDLGPVLGLVYAELRALAETKMGGFPESSLQPTEVLSEAYLRLVEKNQRTWHNRRHFFYVAGRAMRDVIRDHLRARSTGKRNPGQPLIPLDSIREILAGPQEHYASLVDAVQQLGEEDRGCATIVELRFFYGLNREETAAQLGISARTVDRRWVYSRARLHELMN